jgi:hypothetical protein
MLKIVSGITFIRYAQNLKIGNTNNLKFWGIPDEGYSRNDFEHT